MSIRSLSSMVVMWCVAIAGFGADAPTQDEPGRAEAVTARLKTQLAEWLAANFDPAADADFGRRLSTQMDQCLANGDNVRIVIDGGSLRGGQAKYLITWAGQMLAFDLTTAQCRASGASAKGAVASTVRQDEASDAWDPLPFTLEGLRIDNIGGIKGDEPITGSVKCRTTGLVPPGRLVLRTMYRTETSSRIGLKFFDKVPDDGVFKFSVELQEKEGVVHFGPTPVLVDVLLTSGMVERGTVASNAVGAVADVLPDPEGYMRAGLQFMERITAIMASVKDEATAAQALNDYTECALKNQSLVEAMERMGPVPAELDAELSKKYNPQIEAVAARMQVELTRLEQAPYAGEAFFQKIEAMMREE